MLSGTRLKLALGHHSFEDFRTCRFYVENMIVKRNLAQWQCMFFLKNDCSPVCKKKTALLKIPPSGHYLRPEVVIAPVARARLSIRDGLDLQIVYRCVSLFVKKQFELQNARIDMSR